MKRTITLIGIALLFAACSGRKNTQDNGQKNDNGGGNQGGDIIIPDSSSDSGNGGNQGGQDIGPVSGTTVVQVQKGDDSVNCDPTSKIQTVKEDIDMAPVVVVSPQFVASKDKDTGDVKLYGYFVSDVGLKTAAPYSGIEITLPPDLDPGIKQGDVIQFTADHVEFYCMSELKPKTTPTVKGTGDVPLPAQVTPDDISNSNAESAEKYEGVLVKLNNVSVTNADLGHGNFEVAGKVIVNASKFDTGYTPVQGDVFSSLTGIVIYSYGKYVLIPRSSDDIVLASHGEGTPGGGSDAADATPSQASVQQIQQSKSSTDCSASGKQSIEKNIQLSVVVVSPKFVASAKGHLDGYFMCDADKPNAKSACIKVVMKQDNDTGFDVGDLLDITGDYNEYYCESEVFGAQINKSGHNDVNVQPIKINAADYLDSTDPKWEELEGNLVEIDNVKCTAKVFPGSDGKDHGDFMVEGDGQNTGIIINDMFRTGYVNTKDPSSDMRAKDKQYQKIVGFVIYSFGHYRIAPPSKDDIVEAH